MSHEVRPTSDEPKEWLGLTPRRRHEVEREYIANALYLGIVLYVTLAVIPPDDLPSDRDLVLLIIGTGADRVIKAAHKISQRGAKGNIKNLLVGKVVLAKAVNIGLGNGRSIVADFFGVFEHSHIPRRQTGMVVILLDLYYLLGGAKHLNKCFPIDYRAISGANLFGGNEGD